MKETIEKHNNKTQKTPPNPSLQDPWIQSLQGKKKPTEHKQTTPTRMKTNYLLFNFIFNMSYVYLACGYFPKDM